MSMFDVARPPAPHTFTGPVRVHIEWSSPDPHFADVLRAIADLPTSTPERHDAEAFLHMTLARASWRTADRLRDQQTRNQARTRRLTADRARDGRRTVTKGTCPSCAATVRLRLDGTLRAHAPGTGGGSISTRRSYCPGAGQPPAST